MFGFVGAPLFVQRTPCFTQKALPMVRFSPSSRTFSASALTSPLTSTPSARSWEEALRSATPARKHAPSRISNRHVPPCTDTRARLSLLYFICLCSSSHLTSHTPSASTQPSRAPSESFSCSTPNDRLTYHDSPSSVYPTTALSPRRTKAMFGLRYVTLSLSSS